MSNKLLIYIVSHQRKSFTQGTIECVHRSKPPNSQVIVCDNGSTDGTREWLKENQNKYDLEVWLPESNLRVPGAWTLAANKFNETDFEYVLLLDNDGWLLPDDTWFHQCLELLNSDPHIGSLGLHEERKPGYYVFDKVFDHGFDQKKPFNNFSYYDTVFYAAFRLDKFSLFHKTMKNWPHKFIGDKIGRHYNQLGYRTLKVTPGFVVDISECNFNNKSHQEYNQWFFERERDGAEGGA